MIKRWEIRENTLTDNSVYILLVDGTDDSAENISVVLPAFCRLIEAKIPPFTHVFELYNITDDSTLEKIRIKIEEISNQVAIEGDINERTKHVDLDLISPATEILGRNPDVDGDVLSAADVFVEPEAESDPVFDDMMEPSELVPTKRVVRPEPASNPKAAPAFVAPVVQVAPRPQVRTVAPMPAKILKPAVVAPSAARLVRPAVVAPSAARLVKPAVVAPSAARLVRPAVVAPRAAEVLKLTPVASQPVRPATTKKTVEPINMNNPKETDIFAVSVKAPESKVSAADIFGIEKSSSGKVHLSDGDFSIKQDFASQEELELNLESNCDVGDGTFINLSSAESTHIKGIETENSMLGQKQTRTQTKTLGIATLIGGEYPEEVQSVPSLKLMGSLANDAVQKQRTLIDDPYKKQNIEQGQQKVVKPLNKFMPAIEGASNTPSLHAERYTPAPESKTVGYEDGKQGKIGGLFGKFFNKIVAKVTQHSKSLEDSKPLNFQEPVVSQARPSAIIEDNSTEDTQPAVERQVQQPVRKPVAPVKPAPANAFASLASHKVERPVAGKPKASAPKVSSFRSIAPEQKPGALREVEIPESESNLSAKIQVDDIFAADTICEFYAEPGDTGNANQVDAMLENAPASAVKTKTNNTVDTANLGSVKQKPAGGFDDFFDVPNLLSAAPAVAEPVVVEEDVFAEPEHAVEDVLKEEEYSPRVEVAESETIKDSVIEQSITSKLAADKPVVNLGNDITKTKTPFIFTSSGQAVVDAQNEKPMPKKPLGIAKPAFSNGSVKAIPAKPVAAMQPKAERVIPVATAQRTQAVAMPVEAVDKPVARVVGRVQASVKPVMQSVVAKAASIMKKRAQPEPVIMEEPEYKGSDDSTLGSIIDLKNIGTVSKVQSQVVDMSAMMSQASDEANGIETNITEFEDGKTNDNFNMGKPSYNVPVEEVEPISEYKPEPINYKPVAQAVRAQANDMAQEDAQSVTVEPAKPAILPIRKAPPPPSRMNIAMRAAAIRPISNNIGRVNDLNKVKENNKVQGEMKADMTQNAFKDTENLNNDIPAVPRTPVAPRPVSTPVPPVQRPVVPGARVPAAAPINRPVTPVAPRPAVMPVGSAPVQRPAVKPMPEARAATALDHTILVSSGQIYKKNNWPLEIPLNPLFTFDTMDMASNRFAHATAMSVIDNVGSMHNPFMVYGDGGTGKTHFLNAMGYEISKSIGQEKILFTNGVRFSRGVQRYVEEGNISHLEDFLSSVEVLIVDDIHLTAVNEHNRDFISRVLNKFLQEKKQILISSKYPPESLARFEELVRFRLDQGWVSELKQPRPQHFPKIYNRMISDAELGLEEEQSKSFFNLDNPNLGSISKNIKRAKVLSRRINNSGMIQMNYDHILSEMLATNGENLNSEILGKDFADIINLTRSENVDWGNFGFFYPQDQADKFKWIGYCVMQKAKELGIKGGFNFALKSSYSTDHIISSAFKIANICDNKNLKGAIVLGPALSVCQASIRDNFYDILSHMLEVMMIRCGIVDAENIKNPSAYVRVLGDVLK